MAGCYGLTAEGEVTHDVGVPFLGSVQPSPPLLTGTFQGLPANFFGLASSTFYYMGIPRHFPGL